MAKPLRVLVTGSREWPEPGRVHEELWHAAAECRASQLTVIHGGARGADEAAHGWCVATPVFGRNLYVVEEVHRPDWTGQGKGAGHWRNRRMVDSGIDLCLAFIFRDSPGASHCLNYAIKAGVPYRTWSING